MEGILYGVSVGPGDPELMTLKAVRVIQECEIIAVPRSSERGELIALGIARRALPEIADKQIIELSLPMTRNPDLLEQKQSEAAQILAAHLCEGANIAFLTLGDVSIYSTYIYIQKRIQAMGLRTEMVAGVPSFCAAAARLGIALTGDPSKPLHIVPGSYTGVEEALAWNGTKVLMKTGRSLEGVKVLLHTHCQYDQAQMVERCGLEGERIYHSLDQADASAGYLSLIIVPDE